MFLLLHDHATCTQAFLEITHKQTAQKTASKVKAQSTDRMSARMAKGGGMMGGGALGGMAGGAGSVPGAQAPPCACRMCKERLSGKLGDESPGVGAYGGTQTHGLQRPRNPMNMRTYAGGTPPGAGGMMGMMGAKARL